MRRRTTLPPALPSDGRPVTSLERGLQILRHLGSGEQVLAAGNIATRLGVSRPSALRLLESLCNTGHVVRIEGTDQFKVAGEAILLGQAYLSGSALVRRAKPLLQGLADQGRCHVVLCVPSEEGMLTVLYQHSKSLVAKPRLGPGTLFRMESSAVGHAWLWKQDPEVQAAFLARLRSQEPEAVGHGQAAMLYRSFHELEKTGTCEVAEPRKGFAMAAACVEVSRERGAIVGAIFNGGEDEDSPNTRRLRLHDVAERIVDVMQRHRH